MISIFTPTYNRAHTIHRVWNSLIVQTYTDFEWVIIDDGSVDGIDDIVKRYKIEASFPIIYFKFSENRGKHIATNKALELATRKFFVVADSDDAFTPDALQFFMDGWESIPLSESEKYCGIRACCMDQFGTRVSDILSMEPLISSMADAFFIHKFRKESWCMVRTDLHRNWLFPDDHIDNFYPEGIIWSKMSEHHLLRFYNKATRIYYVGQGDNTSLMNTNIPYKKKIKRNITIGSFLFQDNTKYITKDIPYFFKASVVYSCYAFLNRSFIVELCAIKNNLAKGIFLLGSPIGYLYHLKMKISEYKQI